MTKICSFVKENKYVNKIVKFDYVLLFAMLLAGFMLANYLFVMSLFLAYFYAALYLLIRKIVLGQGVSFLNIFLIFFLGVLLLPGSVYLILDYFMA